MSENIENNQYEFFKKAKFDANGNLLVSTDAASTLVFGRGLQVISGVVTPTNTYYNVYDTANRPAHEVGLVIIDSDLGYPIFSDGYDWIDFSGNIV